MTNRQEVMIALTCEYAKLHPTFRRETLDPYHLMDIVWSDNYRMKGIQEDVSIAMSVMDRFNMLDYKPEPPTYEGKL